MVGEELFNTNQNETTADLFNTNQNILHDQMPIFLVKKSCKPIWLWGLGGTKTR
jgi:hypothetical protein